MASKTLSLAYRPYRDSVNYRKRSADRMFWVVFLSFVGLIIGIGEQLTVFWSVFLLLIVSFLLPELGLVLVFHNSLLYLSPLKILSIIGEAFLSPVFFVLFGTLARIMWDIMTKRNENWMLGKSFRVFLLVSVPVGLTAVSLVIRESVFAHSVQVTLYQLVSFMMVPFFLACLVLVDEVRCRRFIYGFTVLLSFTTFQLIRQNLMNPNVLGGYFRIVESSGEMLPAITVGRIAGITVIISFWLLISKSIDASILLRLVCLAGLISGTGLLLLSNQFGPVMSCVIVILWLLLNNIFGSRKKLGRFLRFLMIILVISLVVYLAWGILNDFGNKYTLSYLEHTLLDVRVGLWRRSLEVWFQNPFIGIGFMNFRRFGYPYFARYPHNILLDILVSGGLVAAIATFPLVLSVVSRWKNFPNKFAVVLLSKAIVIFGLLNAMVSGTFSTNHFLYLGLALLFSFSTHEKE